MYGGTNRKTGGKAGGSKTKVHFQFFCDQKGQRQNLDDLDMCRGG